jgi:hypothetical protein
MASGVVSYQALSIFAYVVGTGTPPDTTRT